MLGGDRSGTRANGEEFDAPSVRGGGNPYTDTVHGHGRVFNPLRLLWNQHAVVPRAGSRFDAVLQFIRRRPHFLRACHFVGQVNFPGYDGGIGGYRSGSLRESLRFTRARIWTRAQTGAHAVHPI